MNAVEPELRSEALAAEIRAEAKRRGPIPFSRFMELALYHPELGYYPNADPLQDYYTSADVHPVFGRVLARRISETWKERGWKDFSVVELGCGWGKLAGTVLDWLAAQAPACYRALRYTGIETSALRRRSCEQACAPHAERARFVPEFDFPARSLNGIVFSNEFFDALPVERVRVRGGKLEQAFVDSSLHEVFMSAEPRTGAFFPWLGARPAEGCLGEAQLAAQSWAEKLARTLRDGVILTVDYGYEAPELYAEIRAQGTLLAHYNHRTNQDHLARPGLQDLTAHVNFTVLRKSAEAWGFKSERLITQSQFLLDHGAKELEESLGSAREPRAKIKAAAAIQSLLHPEGMGGTFKVLMQRTPSSEG